jgi:two-component system, sensor histidine kinase PdtaS
MAFAARASGRYEGPVMNAAPPPLANVADSLSMAMVAASDAPLLLLDGDLMVIAASSSFYRTFQIDQDSAEGTVFQLGSGEWNMPRLRSLLTATISGGAAIEAYELDLKGEGLPTRRLVIKPNKLDYGAGAARLLVTITDVTEARIAERVRDDLLRDKEVLLREIQHRVANSLQIIASVLLQSARNVQSDEVRSHLSDAHNRVMSIAKVQQHLATSGADGVELVPYFTELCQSLGASMIRDHNKQSLKVSGDANVVSADVSVSLGLIVTELVINALKHAFPGERAGRIAVDYRSHGPNWTLSVRDDGVGMPADPANAPRGLGSGIVEALARQLHALVKVADAKPGTTVSIVHAQIVAVSDGLREETAERAV